MRMRAFFISPALSVFVLYFFFFFGPEVSSGDAGRVPGVPAGKFRGKKDKKGIKIIVDVDTITLYFERSLDLRGQRQKISKKIVDLDQKIFGITSKLKNKSFLNNAPKEIVEKEKKALINYKIELKKLNSILNSIKN